MDEIEQFQHLPEPGVLTEVGAVFLAAFADPPHGVGEDARQAYEDMVRRDSGRDRFRLVVARAAGRAIGFGHGHRCAEGQEWRDAVVKELPHLGNVLDGAFVVVEFGVAPEMQRRGVGRAMLHELIPAGTESVVLSTMDLDSPARRLYQSEGFDVLGSGVTFGPDDPPYVVMGRRSAG
jgi:ribosomal protein S18 acetylase RimI-like enzyme